MRLIFKDIYEFKEALKNYTIRDGRDILFIKNDKNRVTIEYKNKCEWRFHASNVTRKISFQIKTFNDVHNYGKNFMNN